MELIWLHKSDLSLIKYRVVQIGLSSNKTKVLSVQLGKTLSFGVGWRGRAHWALS